MEGNCLCKEKAWEQMREGMKLVAPEAIEVIYSSG